MPINAATNPCLVFEFKAEELQKLFFFSPYKIVCTCFIEAVKDEYGKPVGVMRIIAEGAGEGQVQVAYKEDPIIVEGEPRPPGIG